MLSLVSRWHKSINEIPEQHWNNLIGHQSNPFYQWKWLHKLENSGSISPKQGWHPRHLGIWRRDILIAVAPLYLKGHSYGEFIFDQVFVRLAVELGIYYYPKLLGMSPLSPVDGYQFFYAPKEDSKALTIIMMDAIDRFAFENGISSCNFLYVDPAWSSLAKASGCVEWLNQKSLWSSSNNANFSDYLKRFNSNQRRNIKRERKVIKDAGIKVSAITGNKINKELLTVMHDFYEDHCQRWGPWGSKYLSCSFFEQLSNLDQRDQIVLFSAHHLDPQDPIAMSLCIKDKNMLWGRYWGSKEEIDCLHFEVCYYSPIAWALDQGITHFDPGAGGSHKSRRGFVAKSTISLHRWYDKRMEVLISAWLDKVNTITSQEIEAANNQLPFKTTKPRLPNESYSSNES